uniref:Uncharacterized protein n=1 Tax=Anguilla anguilla TaxID=7936 RepID=A0A0E9SUA7_ANGAN
MCSRSHVIGGVIENRTRLFSI